MKDVEQKIYLKKGIQLKPIAEIGTWVQVETEDGQIGLVDFEILKGSRFIYVPSKAMVSKTVNGNITDTLVSGTPAVITERKIVKGRFGDELHFNTNPSNGSSKPPEACQRVVFFNLKQPSD